MSGARVVPLLLAAVLAACASGPARISRPMGTWDATGLGDTRRVESFEGTVVRVYDADGIRTVVVRGEGGVEQAIDASGDIEVEAEEAGQVVPGEPFTVRYKVHLPMTGDHLLWAARDGGAHIRGNLLEQIDGRWLAHRMRIVLTPAQVVAAQELQRQELAAQANARQQEAAQRDAALRARIAAWRAQPVKPPLPAEAERYRLLAEKAVLDRRYDEARVNYARALEIEPLWPQGQRAMAQLDADARAYRSAIRHMQLYLELVPDAPDLLPSRARIQTWEQLDLKQKQR